MGQERGSWRVADVGPDGSLTVTRSGRGLGRRIVLPASYVAEHVRLGYATTIHSAQGFTVHASAADPAARQRLPWAEAIADAPDVALPGDLAVWRAALGIPQTTSDPPGHLSLPTMRHDISTASNSACYELCNPWARGRQTG
ncbi:MAG TPA: hypothetical protein VF086_18025 [Propionibacteriaceae bacterium]